jgi:hypothetical protein
VQIYFRLVIDKILYVHAFLYNLFWSVIQELNVSKCAVFFCSVIIHFTTLIALVLLWHLKKGHKFSLRIFPASFITEMTDYTAPKAKKYPSNSFLLHNDKFNSKCLFIRYHKTIWSMDWICFIKLQDGTVYINWCKFQDSVGQCILFGANSKIGWDNVYKLEKLPRLLFFPSVRYIDWN